MARKINIGIPSIPEIELHITGDWQRAITMGEGISSSIKKGYDKGVNKFSRSVLKIIQRAIRSGTPPSGSGVFWQPLSPATIKTWGLHRIYNLNGVLLRSIGIQRYKSRTFIGIPIGKRPGNQRAKLTLNQVAIVLEYGSSDGRIPSRPLFNPSMTAAGGREKLRKDIIWGIRSQLYIDLGVNPKQIRLS